MDATLRILLESVEEYRADPKGGDEDDVYVWWGKVRSPTRHQPLPHLADILSIDKELSGEDAAQREVHLYLTDFQSLFVGHVGEVTADDASEDEHHVPEFYRRDGLACDCWFRLWDIRRIVADDTRAVAQELVKLHNVRDNGRPVSIYGGLAELPLIVTRPDGARYFGADVRAHLTDGKFWVEFDAQRGGMATIERELRDNLFGDAAWDALDPAARGFVAAAERLFRANRGDASFDFGPVIVDFGKAFEVQVNLILRRALQRAEANARYANVDGRTVDPASGEMWSLGQLARIIGHEQFVNRALKAALVHGDWFTTSLPPILADLADLRNRAAHSARLGLEEATRLRNRLVGVGGAGVLVELAKVRLK